MKNTLSIEISRTRFYRAMANAQRADGRRVNADADIQAARESIEAMIDAKISRAVESIEATIDAKIRRAITPCQRLVSEPPRPPCEVEP